MDVKKLGRIPDGGGWKVHGRGHKTLERDYVNKVGYDYVHSLVDGHSRLVYAVVLNDEKGQPARNSWRGHQLLCRARHKTH